MGDASLSLQQIEERAGAILDGGKRPFLLGGEHLVTLGAFRAVYQRWPELRILHFDAHADLRDDYLGVKLSHACAPAPVLGAGGGREDLPVRHSFRGPGGVPLGEGPRLHPQV